MKYKAGDKVKIVNERPNNPAFGWSSEMDKFLGKVVTIGTTFEEGDCNGYTLVENPDTEDEMGYMWSNEMIAGLVEEKPVMKTTESLLESLHKERADIEVKIKRIGKMIASGQLSAYDNELLAIQQRAYKTVSLTLSVRINKIAHENKNKASETDGLNIKVSIQNVGNTENYPEWVKKTLNLVKND